jgi:FdhD protein
MLASKVDFYRNEDGLKSVMALASNQIGTELKRQQFWLVTEDSLTINVVDVGDYTLMWTPTQALVPPLGYSPDMGICCDHGSTEALALALGFVFTEGIISSLNQIKMMSVCPDEPSIVRVTLFEPAKAVTYRKNIIMTSSCGVCGGREAINNSLNKLPKVGRVLTINSNKFPQLMKDMRCNQAVFEQSGGSHAAAVFNSFGNLMCSAEDLGRHNALDKVIGDCLLHDISMKGKGVLLSSRISLEMVTKAAMAGIEIIAAVSAPTSLAVKVAEQCGITLCGFVRGQRMTIYSHPQRIENT